MLVRGREIVVCSAAEAMARSMRCFIVRSGVRLKCAAGGFRPRASTFRAFRAPSGAHQLEDVVSHAHQDHSDGSVFMCINDEYGKQIIGNARHESLQAIWLGPKMREMRRIHREKKGVDMIDICRSCYLPRKRVATEVDMGGRLIQVDNYVNR